MLFFICIIISEIYMEILNYLIWQIRILFIRDNLLVIKIKKLKNWMLIIVVLKIFLCLQDARIAKIETFIKFIYLIIINSLNRLHLIVLNHFILTGYLLILLYLNYVYFTHILYLDFNKYKNSIFSLNLHYSFYYIFIWSNTV